MIEIEERFISSLISQPLVVVLRPSQDEITSFKTNNSLYQLVQNLKEVGVKHIEISWSPNSYWSSLMRTLKEEFSTVQWGAASITTQAALDAVKDLDLSFAMTPFLDNSLQNHAIEIHQLLIPGVFSPSEMNQAKNLGCRVVKLFPASVVGIQYCEQLSSPLGELPFMIAAGGLKVSDLQPWLAAGYGALALGRELVRNKKLDPSLVDWLNAQLIKD